MDSGYSAQRGLQLRALAHLVVAESAQALQNRSLRDEHLQLALEQPVQKLGAEIREGLALRAARWALEDRDPAQALEHLQRLPAGVGRRLLALRMRLKAARLARQIPQALETARLLTKHRAFSEQGAQSLVRSLAIECLQTAVDAQQVKQMWQSLEEAERAMPEVAVHAAARLMDLGGQADLSRKWLEPVWRDGLDPRSQLLPQSLRVRLVLTLERGLDSIDDAYLSGLESALQMRPLDAHLQYLAGMACLHRQLWGKAQLLLAQSVTQIEDATLRRRAWRALARLAEQRGDSEAAAQAYRKIADL